MSEVESKIELYKEGIRAVQKALAIAEVTDCLGDSVEPLDSDRGGGYEFHELGNVLNYCSKVFETNLAYSLRWELKTEPKKEE